MAFQEVKQKCCTRCLCRDLLENVVASPICGVLIVASPSLYEIKFVKAQRRPSGDLASDVFVDQSVYIDLRSLAILPVKFFIEMQSGKIPEKKTGDLASEVFYEMQSVKIPKKKSGDPSSEVSFEFQY